MEPFGWRFGLDRIRRLVSALGMPQHRFASVHVVGTNGKSSVTEMTSALLEAHGLRTGAYLSPHEVRWSERIRVGGAVISPDAFASAVERVAGSVEAVNRTLADDDDVVTQFEALTAAAFVALAGAGVEVGVIEAGLGGRLDATNVLSSRVTALTSVGLEHTQWLGETETEIAAEKLAVLRDHSMLVLGEVGDDVEALARRVAAERNARIVAVRGLSPQVELTSPAPYVRRNFAVALACADAVVERLDPERVQAVAAGLELDGRAEVVEGDPTLILDAAHNPAGARALAEALPAVVGKRPVVACLAVLADKDAEGIVAELASHLVAAVMTEIPTERLESVGRPGARAFRAEELARAAREAQIATVEARPDPEEAVARALELARQQGAVALVSGSHYLLRYASEA
ncbi:MAG TPA: cyanophycin synthetase [Solirubrobacterales bacterium]|jgi:dihydrofolate synthase / folylpolyglutamate synthase|nr:cyanophycin synthetase [Solirubrobacterales bacterium]